MKLFRRSRLLHFLNPWKSQISFEKWMERLKWAWKNEIFNRFNESYWRDWFDRGYSHEEARKEAELIFGREKQTCAGGMTEVEDIRFWWGVVFQGLCIFVAALAGFFVTVFLFVLVARLAIKLALAIT